MIKSTPEIESKIKASGKPIIEITMEQLLSAEKVKEIPKK
jgi:hypothetical protein